MGQLRGQHKSQQEFHTGMKEEGGCNRKENVTEKSRGKNKIVLRSLHLLKQSFGWNFTMQYFFFFNYIDFFSFLSFSRSVFKKDKTSKILAHVFCTLNLDSHTFYPYNPCESLGYKTVSAIKSVFPSSPGQNWNLGGLVKRSGVF